MKRWLNQKKTGAIYCCIDGAGKRKADRYVPIETYTALVTEVATLSAKVETTDAATLLKDAKDQGKVLAAEESYLQQFAQQKRCCRPESPAGFPPRYCGADCPPNRYWLNNLTHRKVRPFYRQKISMPPTSWGSLTLNLLKQRRLNNGYGNRCISAVLVYRV